MKVLRLTVLLAMILIALCSCGQLNNQGNVTENQSDELTEQIIELKKQNEELLTGLESEQRVTSNVMPSITPSILENQEKDSVGMVTPSLSPEYTLDEMDKEMYLNSSAYLLDIPEIKGRKITILGCGNKVRVTGRCKETG